MSFIDRLNEKVRTGPVANYGFFTLYGSGEVGQMQGLKMKREPLSGVSARVESGAEIQKRVTATRLVTIGLFALVAKKKKGGESFITIEGPGFFWTDEVKRGDQRKAQAFAAKVNDAARKLR